LDPVAGQGGEVGEQGLEAVDGKAVRSTLPALARAEGEGRAGSTGEDREAAVEPGWPLLASCIDSTRSVRVPRAGS